MANRSSTGTKRGRSIAAGLVFVGCAAAAPGLLVENRIASAISAIGFLLASVGLFVLLLMIRQARA